MERRKLTVLSAAGAGTAAIACITAMAAVFLVLKEGRSVVANARDLAQKRPEATIIHSNELPDIGGLKTHWLKMVPFRGGALAVGRANMVAPPVLVALDANGAPTAQGSLPGGACEAIELVAIGSENAIVACATSSNVAFIGVRFDGARLITSTLPGSSGPGSSQGRCQVIGSTLGQHHFWLWSRDTDDWVIGFGEGLRSPAFASLANVSGVSDLAVLSDSEAVVATVENESSVEMVVASPSGEIKRRVSVTKGAPEDLAIARPQIFVDPVGILVAWVTREPQPLSAWFAPDKSILLVQRFDYALRPLGEPERLSEDSFVVPFHLEQTTAGGIITWDQGVRESWNVPSVIWFDSALMNRQSSVLRVPSGRWPNSFVATQAGVLALLSYDDSRKMSYHTIVLKP